jgi:hypothetical protein
MDWRVCRKVLDVGLSNKPLQLVAKIGDCFRGLYLIFVERLNGKVLGFY